MTVLQELSEAMPSIAMKGTIRENDWEGRFLIMVIECWVIIMMLGCWPAQSQKLVFMLVNLTKHKKLGY